MGILKYEWLAIYIQCYQNIFCLLIIFFFLKSIMDFPSVMLIAKTILQTIVINTFLLCFIVYCAYWVFEILLFQIRAYFKPSTCTCIIHSPFFFVVQNVLYTWKYSITTKMVILVNIKYILKKFGFNFGNFTFSAQ